MSHQPARLGIFSLGSLKVYKYGLCLPGIIAIISQQMILQFLRSFIFPNLRFAIFNQILQIHKLIHIVFFYWIKGTVLFSFKN